jgi:hypothetical protein
LPDLPQGSSKKIEFNLLLADLAFQLGYPIASRSNIFHPYRMHRSVYLCRPSQLARPTRSPQSLRPISSEMGTPLRQVTTSNP